MAADSSKQKDKSIREADLILTPGGWRPKSKVFKVAHGNHVEVQDGRLKVIHTATGKVVVDLDEVPTSDADNSKQGGSEASSRGKVKNPTKKKSRVEQ